MNARLDALIASALAGDRRAASELARGDWPEAQARLRHHGVLPLVAEILLTAADVPPAVGASLHEETTRHAAADLVREFELTRLLDAFEQAGVNVLLMKGAQLAYTHYARPDLRPRIDTDLLVSEASREATREVLHRLGYQATGHVSGALVTYQGSFVRTREKGAAHIVDVHWRVFNPHAFAAVFSYEEMASRAKPVPRLGPSARGLSPVDALLVACVHRVAHHFDTDRLIWLHDIHLIASSLDHDEWLGAVDLAVTRGVATVCLQSVRRAQEVFRTVVPADALDTLTSEAGRADRATAAYLVPSRRRRVQVLASDLRSLPSWTDRLRLLRQHVFPPAPYMRNVYAPASNAPLVMLYAKRGLLGARKWLARR